MTDASRQSKWANVKLRRPFVRWLKIEAAQRGQFMGELVEKLVADSLGASPWLAKDGMPSASRSPARRA